MGEINIIVCNNSLVNKLLCIHKVLGSIPPSTMLKTSLEIRAHIIALHVEQQNCHIKARKLGTIPSTIGRIIKHYHGATRKLKDKGRIGHPQILSERDDHYLA